MHFLFCYAVVPLLFVSVDNQMNVCTTRRRPLPLGLLWNMGGCFASPIAVLITSCESIINLQERCQEKLMFFFRLGS